MDRVDRRIIRTSRVLAMGVLLAFGLVSNGAAHQIEGTETTLTVNGDLVSFNIKTSETALVRLLGEDQAIPSDLMHHFMQKLVIQNASGNCTEIERIEVAYDHDLTGTGVVRCDTIDLLTISTTLGMPTNTSDLHLFKIILDGHITVTMLPFEEDEIKLPVTRLRNAWN